MDARRRKLHALARRGLAAALIALAGSPLPHSAGRGADGQGRDGMILVQWVVDECNLVLGLDGLPVPVKLAGVTLASLADAGAREGFRTKAREYLMNDLKSADRRVRVEVCKTYDVRKGGIPLVYVYFRPEQTEILLNKRLLLKGYASCDAAELDDREVRSMKNAEQTARERRLGLWALAGAEAAAEPPKPEVRPAPVSAAEPVADVIDESRYYAEQGNQTFHRGTCAWVKRINPARREDFAGEQEALAAGKNPCRSCCPEAAAGPAAKVRGRTGVGRLIGLPDDRLFHHHDCPLLKHEPASSFTYLESLDAARGSGRVGCPSCIAFGNPNIPQPEEGQCIGRGRPFFRPCMRPIEFKATRLCRCCGGADPAQPE